MLERRTLRIVGFAAACFLAYVVIEVIGAEPRARARRRAESLFGALPTEVEEIRLGSGVTLLRGPAGFTLTSPVEAQADPEAVQSLVVRLLEPRRERRLEIPADSLAAFGLASPRAWGSVRRKGGGTVTVELGAPTATANSLYGRIRETGETFVVWGSLLRDLLRKADELRDRRLVDARTGEIGALSLERPRGSVALRRDAHGAWRFEGSPGGRASAERVAGLVDAILAARVRVFLDSAVVAPRDAAADRRVARLLRLPPDGAPPESLAISIGEVSAEGGLLPVLAAGQPRPVLADPELLSLLDTGADSLREDRLLPFGAESVSGLRIAVGADTIALERAGEAWRIVRPESLDADPVRVRAFLRNLENLRVARWGTGATDEETGLDLPRAEVAIALSGGRAGDGFRVGAAAGEEERWAAFLGEEESFVIPEAVVSILSPDPAVFEARAFLAPAIAGAGRIEIDAGEGRSATLVKRGGTWRAEGQVWSDARSADTVLRLGRLEPLDHVTLPEGGAGLADSPSGLRVTWDGPRAGVLTVGGALDPERRFARVSGRRGLYLLYAPDVDSLLAESRGPSR